MEYGLYKFGNGTGKYVTSPYSETSVVNATMKAVRAEYPDAIIIKIHGGGYQRAGLPDLYIGVRGISLWIEMKCEGSDTTALQKRFLEQLHTNGVPCGTAEKPTTVLKMLSELIG